MAGGGGLEGWTGPAHVAARILSLEGDGRGATGHREGVMHRVDLALVCIYGKGCSVSRRRGRSSALSDQSGQLGLEGESEALAGTGEGIPGRTGQEVSSFTLEEQFHT